MSQSLIFLYSSVKYEYKILEIHIIAVLDELLYILLHSNINLYIVTVSIYYYEIQYLLINSFCIHYLSAKRMGYHDVCQRRL